jgi:hypothetical protein
VTQALRKIPQWVDRCLIWIASPRLLFYALPWLMLLLVLGTLTQAEIGLYRAEKIYFSSFFLWLDLGIGLQLPLPGGLMTLMLIGAGLAAKLLRQKQWRGRWGTSLIHFAILALLIGGAITAMTRSEGFVELAPQAELAEVHDFHARELRIWRDDQVIALYGFKTLSIGKKLAGLPFGLEVVALCRHCELVPRKAPAKEAGAQALAQALELQSLPLLPEDEANLSGVTLRLSGVGDGQDGLYLAFAPLPKERHAIFSANGHSYRLELRRETRSLPFSLRLEEFVREHHRGTDLASAYRSKVTVIDGARHWQEEISLNQPLRYRGYVVYQTAFREGEKMDQPTHSILTVVRDHGQIFPYLSLTCVCLGMGIHLLSALRKRRSRAAS